MRLVMFPLLNKVEKRLKSQNCTDQPMALFMMSLLVSLILCQISRVDIILVLAKYHASPSLADESFQRQSWYAFAVDVDSGLPSLVGEPYTGVELKCKVFYYVVL